MNFGKTTSLTSTMTIKVTTSKSLFCWMQLSPELHKTHPFQQLASNFWAVAWNHFPYFIINSNFCFYNSASGPFNFHCLFHQPVSNYGTYSILRFTTSTPKQHISITNHFSNLHLHLTSCKQQMPVRRLFSVSAISPDFPVSVPAFHKENQWQLYTSGVFLLASRHKFPLRFSFRYRCILCNIVRHQICLQSTLGCTFPMQKTNHHKKNCRHFLWVDGLPNTNAFIFDQHWSTRLSLRSAFVAVNTCQTYAFTMGICEHFMVAHLIRTCPPTCAL